MNGEVALGFADAWIWVIFVGIGLILVLLELLLSVDTGLDMVFIGSAFVLGGLITWPFHLWGATLIVTAVICVVYVFIGRRYIHNRMAVKLEKTNIDAIIGRKGTVLKNIAPGADGRIKVGGENWRARAEEAFSEGDEVIVTSVSGVTLIVEKSEGSK
jgi:membrane protein implicated in regulation of membrane protease activity